MMRIAPRLGRGDSNNELGITTILAPSAGTNKRGLELVIGPLNFQQFREFLPCEDWI